MPISASQLYSNPDAALAELSRREMDRYNTDYVPVENAAIASLNDTSLISAARKNAEVGFQPSSARLTRSLSRYGVTQGAVDQRESDMGFKMGRALSGANEVNNARIDQFDRNREVRNSLINFGRGVAGDAYSGFSSSALMKTERDAANRAASANNKASRIALGGSLAAAGILLL